MSIHGLEETPPLDLSSVKPRLRARLRAAANASGRLSGAALAEMLSERIQNSRDRRHLAAARNGRKTCWVDVDEGEPLISVRIVTFDRHELLMERALPSVLAQSYGRLEVLVVGDHADERTERAVAGVRDSRVRYINLPRRPIYPSEGWARWAQLGVDAHNLAIELSAGAWLSVCDDDDVLLADHVEKLHSRAMAEQVELVHGRTLVDLGDGRRGILGTGEMQRGHTTHGAVLVSAGLRFFRYRSSCAALRENQDWNLWRRMRACGVSATALDHAGYIYLPTGPTLEAFRRVADRAELGTRRGD